MTARSFNRPGSYFGILQGPQGYAGLPRGAGLGCLIAILVLLFVGFLRAIHLIR